MDVIWNHYLNDDYDYYNYSPLYFEGQELEVELAVAQAERDKARNNALEEAAQVCDELRNKDYSSEDERWVAGTDDCAAAIRAMKECGR
jgi:DNA-binding IclR family transcriptional regulator